MAGIIDNPINGRFNASFFEMLDGYMHRKYEGIISDLLAGIPPVVVEPGSGSVANLRYPPAVQIRHHIWEVYINREFLTHTIPYKSAARKYSR